MFKSTWLESFLLDVVFILPQKPQRLSVIPQAYENNQYLCMPTRTICGYLGQKHHIGLLEGIHLVEDHFACL